MSPAAENVQQARRLIADLEVPAQPGWADAYPNRAPELPLNIDQQAAVNRYRAGHTMPDSWPLQICCPQSCTGPCRRCRLLCCPTVCHNMLLVATLYAGKLRDPWPHHASCCWKTCSVSHSGVYQSLLCSCSFSLKPCTISTLFLILLLCLLFCYMFLLFTPSIDPAGCSARLTTH